MPGTQSSRGDAALKLMWSGRFSSELRQTLDKDNGWKRQCEQWPTDGDASATGATCGSGNAGTIGVNEWTCRHSRLVKGTTAPGSADKHRPGIALEGIPRKRLISEAARKQATTMQVGARLRPTSGGELARWKFPVETLGRASSAKENRSSASESRSSTDESRSSTN